MRISTFQLFQQRVNNMTQQQLSLSRTEQQLASGKRLVTPADDPAASLRNLQLLDRQSQNTQFIANLDSATGRLDQEEGAISSSINLLQRLRELAVSANNSTMSTSDLQSIEVEVRSLRDGLLAAANTRNANGEYLFSGYRSGTVPFVDNGGGTIVYQGDQGQTFLQVSPTRQLAVADNGADVFTGISVAGGGVNSVFDIVDRFAGSLAGGTPDPNALTDIDAAMDQLSSVQAGVGARMRAVDDQIEVNRSFGLALDTERANITDLDYVEAISRFNREMTAFQASEQIFSKVQNLSLFNFLG